jgi:hypothetical protein
MIEIFLILIVVITDVLRDKFFGSIDWWLWHVIKWINFYLPILYIVIKSKLSFYQIVVLSLFSTSLWIIIYIW